MKLFFLFFQLSIFIYNPLFSNDMGISLETNYRNYRPGQSIKISVKLPQAAYLYVLTLQSDGNLNLLFPNEDEKDNMVLSEEIKIPDDSKDYEFLAGDTFGKDTIIAIASRNRIKKLHKSKYWVKPVYKNMTSNNLAWLKKLTKKLPSDQWVSADVNIFISKDSVSEILTSSVRKESKVITASNNNNPSKISSKEKPTKEFLENEVMHGYFKLPSASRIPGNKRGFFSIFKDTDLNIYKLKVLPYLNNKNDTCDYSIVKFTDPRHVSTTYGIVEVVPDECNLKQADEEQKEFWKKITNFYFQYKFKNSGALKGNVWLTGPNDKYNQRLTKPEVRNDFKFLE